MASKKVIVKRASVWVQEEEDSVSLFWITVKVLLFLLPFLLLLRIVTAMRDIRLSRNANGHTADHSFAALLWVSLTTPLCVTSASSMGLDCRPS